MVIVALKVKRIFSISVCLVIIFFIIGLFVKNGLNQSLAAENQNEKKYIKWVSFNVTYPALKKAMDADIKSRSETGYFCNWINILAYLGAKYGGNFSRYKASDMDKVIERIKVGEKIDDITKDMKHFNYYLEAYTAVLGEFIGNYKVETKDESGNIKWEEKYGLKVFSPIAYGYNYNHYDDFGAGRDYG